MVVVELNNIIVVVVVLEFNNIIVVVVVVELNNIIVVVLVVEFKQYNCGGGGGGGIKRCLPPLQVNPDPLASQIFLGPPFPHNARVTPFSERLL